MAGDAILTPEARLSYPNLFEPRANEQGKPKYGCCLIFPRDTNIDALKAALVKVAEAKWGAKAVEMIRKKQLHWPIRDGAERDGDGYGDSVVFFNVNCDNKPGIVDRFKDPKTGKARIITDPAEVYPGMYVRALIRPYVFDVDKKKGPTFGLEHIQKMRDGERLDGRTKLEDAFDAEDGASADDLEDLIGAPASKSSGAARLP